MPAAALDVYARGLAERGTLRVVFADGSARRLPLGLWLGDATGAEGELLDRVRGPALEVGCGPGRHVRALLRRGILAVGLDVCPQAVRLARDGGALAVRGSVFDRVAGAGKWRGVLLLDGSVGIGGDPVALLERVASLLAPDGEAWGEHDPPGTGSGAVQARLEGPEGTSAPFRWGRLGADSAGTAAARAGLSVAESWESGDRRLARLVPAASR